MPLCSSTSAPEWPSELLTGEQYKVLSTLETRSALVPFGLNSVGECWAVKVYGGYRWLKIMEQLQIGTEGCLSFTAAGSISEMTTWALLPGHPILSIPELPGRPGMVALPVRRGDVYSCSPQGLPSLFHLLRTSPSTSPRMPCLPAGQRRIPATSPTPGTGRMRTSTSRSE